MASIRNFDPVHLASLESRMWRAYYDNNYWSLLRLTISLFRANTGSGLFGAARFALISTKAAYNYRKKLDMTATAAELAKFYRLLKSKSHEKFDEDKVAAAELEWWQEHRHGDKGEKLERTLKKHAGLLYGEEWGEFSKYASHKAKAMHHRADAMLNRQVEPDWSQITTELELAYKELKRVIS